MSSWPLSTAHTLNQFINLEFSPYLFDPGLNPTSPLCFYTSGKERLVAGSSLRVISEDNHCGLDLPLSHTGEMKLGAWIGMSINKAVRRKTRGLAWMLSYSSNEN